MTVYLAGLAVQVYQVVLVPLGHLLDQMDQAVLLDLVPLGDRHCQKVQVHRVDLVLLTVLMDQVARFRRESLAILADRRVLLVQEIPVHLVAQDFPAALVVLNTLYHGVHISVLRPYQFNVTYRELLLHMCETSIHKVK